MGSQAARECMHLEKRPEEKWLRESLLGVTCRVDSSLIGTPVVRMISVIYIIEFIVSCLHPTAAVYIFFISESLPASSDGEPRGNIVLFDVVPF